ncbi:MAG: hypothetical protein XD98_0167 [Microgenomates bacterium 39_6]|nr:MAG: hypothetical protein XD98_0167 [Microgenomates bacterium 39_6]
MRAGLKSVKIKVMTKRLAFLSSINKALENRKENWQKFLAKKKQLLKKKLSSWKKIRKRVRGKINQLPHNYRNIAAKLARPLTLAIFWLVFITSLALPANQAEKIKRDFLAQPNNFTNRMKMIEVLIANGYFEAGKKELEAVGHPDFLSKEEKALWQKNYLAWGENSPEGQEMLIGNWQKFLKEHPDYKIGWIYLGYFQTQQGKEESQKSFEKARNIDPGLEKEIRTISNFQTPINQ